jgi:hypothetical protein
VVTDTGIGRTDIDQMALLSRLPTFVICSNNGTLDLKPARGTHVDDVFVFRVEGVLYLRVGAPRREDPSSNILNVN